MQKSKSPAPKNAYPNVSPSLVTRNIVKFVEPTGNVYESINIISKRARQISTGMKEELSERLSEFATAIDNLEEIHENREQIEISRTYEKMPKPSLIATEEFLDGKVYFRRPDAAEIAASAAAASNPTPPNS
ncbi:MAG: DNA-directed RNA polymerase subunit omega [Bacteroidota bacterium]